MTPGVDAGDEQRRGQRRHELHRDEEARRRNRAVCQLEDHDRERNLAEPVAELVREVGAGEAPEAGQGKGGEAPAAGGHRAT